jgi:phytoene synthase
MDKDVHDIFKTIEFENITKHPNILIAARFWDEKRYHAAQICYKFMRLIDDLIDNSRSGDEAISCMEKQVLSEEVNKWLGCLDKTSNHDPFVRELADTISNFKIPLKLFHNFARSMLYDIDHSAFPTFSEFIDYAEGASVAPASVFVHLCCLSEKDGEYLTPDLDVIKVARPCAIFSYIVHIIRDFQEDQLNNLNYFAIDMLDRNNLVPSDLKDIANGGPVTDSFRNLIKEYHNYAQSYSEKTRIEIKNLTPRVNGRYLLSLHIIYNLYKMVFDRIDIENGKFTSEEMNPSPKEIKEKVMECLAIDVT